jgi:hypothetical protein
VRGRGRARALSYIRRSTDKNLGDDANMAAWTTHLRCACLATLNWCCLLCISVDRRNTRSDLTVFALFVALPALDGFATVTSCTASAIADAALVASFHVPRLAATPGYSHLLFKSLAVIQCCLFRISSCPCAPCAASDFTPPSLTFTSSSPAFPLALSRCT